MDFTEFKQMLSNAVWPEVSKESGNFVELKKLKDALDQVGFKLPGEQVNLMIEEFSNKQKLKTPEKLNYNEFEQICIDLKAKEVDSSFRDVGLEEQISFSDWINSSLLQDKDLKHLLPIDPAGQTLYEKIKNGILLCKLINHSCPDTIDERAINKKDLTVYTKFENLTLALVSSSAIGCNIANISAHDLQKGKQDQVLNLLWQIIRAGLFSHITLDSCPGLATLMNDDERLEDLMKLSPEEVLLRWVNHHLANAGVQRRCNNFTSDISDSEIYTQLLKQIAPAEAGVTTEAIHEPDLTNRAETMLQQAAKLNCRSFVTPQDVVNGVYKLNLAFVANLFNNYPRLNKPEQIESLEETREEKTYRNWMNSMGVKPYVNWLYSDLADGLVIFQLFDFIKSGSVNWQRVQQRFSPKKMFMEKLENCNYVIELGREQKFSLVGIAGQDIRDGNARLTMAIIWQLMRAYTLSVLSQLTNSENASNENEIIAWVNKKLASAGKETSIKSFQDKSIGNAKVFLDLIDAIKPGSISYDLVDDGNEQEGKLTNAKYAISMARKFGARVYAVPEDITEVKPKMVMTTFASLMALDYTPDEDVELEPTQVVGFEEQISFSEWINSNLLHDQDLKHLLPIDPEGKTLFEKIKDGILLCKLINHSCPDTIDERALNKKNLTFDMEVENLTLALVSSSSIGCNIVNINADDLQKGKQGPVLNLLWEIISVGLFSHITLESCPGLASLLYDGERLEDLMKLSPEEVLLRWVNHHLANAGVQRRCTNFTTDINDSEIYSHLLKQIAPAEAGVTTEAIHEPDLTNRAETMLQQAAKLNCRSFVRPEDVLNGVHKLNLAFVANLFNNHPGLDKPEHIDGLESIEETREDKTYRNWMNSMGVKPHVNWLYSDLADGIVVFQLFDIIKPGSVNWQRVHQRFSPKKKFMEKLENCNYVIELGKEQKFSLVGIAGQDISDGNARLTLALISQLMRAYTLSVLSQLTNSGNASVENEIIAWVNKKLASAGKETSIKSFQDKSIGNAKVFLDLIDAIKPGRINYDLVDYSTEHEAKLTNAKYAISMARKTGARVYALPEDIVEVKPKMVMTVFACLMALDFTPNFDSVPEPTA